MAKTILTGKYAMEKLLKGLNLAADIVSATIGPKGRNTFISDPYTPKITNDGYTIAKNVLLDNNEEDMGAYVIRNVCGQQNDDVGDGTTTVAILTQAIIQEILKRPENTMEIMASLKDASEKVIKQLKAKSIKVSKDQIERVALISAENPQLAKMISDVIGKLGEKAVINVEDSKTLLTDYEIVDGYEASVGYMSPHFINDKKSGKAIYQDIAVFITEKKISNITDIQPLFEQLKKQNIASCVIVCDDIEDAMLGMFLVNKNMGTFNSLIIKTNGETLKDIAGATGATMVSDQTGVTFQNITIDNLGIAKKVVCDANKTLFIGGGESSKKYAKELALKLEAEPNMWVKKKIEERIAKLNGGIAVLRIAAPNDLEREYLKLKAEDAVKASLAALEEGIVEGGGMALWRIAQAMDSKTIGEQILKRAMITPLRKIIENCGEDYAEVISKMLPGSGYNAKTGEYKIMEIEGIMDPAKVERCALMNAVSAASTLCTSYGLITERKLKKS
jgi:chaperonin GroEL